MKPINIALVENNLHDLNLLTAYIQEAFPPGKGMEFHVMSFREPEKALEYVATQDCPLLITGVELCGMDGLLLARRAQERKPEIGIVLTTQYEEHVLQALQMCVHLQGYLSMPTSKEAVRKLLHSVFFHPAA